VNKLIPTSPLAKVDAKTAGTPRPSHQPTSHTQTNPNIMVKQVRRRAS
jgi:hypothetical protein